MVTLTYSSYDSYLLISNSLLLAGIYSINHYAEAWNLRLLQYLLSLRPVVYFEWILSILGFINIWYASRGINNPILAPFFSSIQPYIFSSGPLLAGLRKSAHDFKQAFKSSKKKPSTTPIEQLIEDTSEKGKEDEVINLFSKRDSAYLYTPEAFKEALASISVSPYAVLPLSDDDTEQATIVINPRSPLYANIEDTVQPNPDDNSNNNDNTNNENNTNNISTDPFARVEITPYLSIIKQAQKKKKQLKLVYTPCIRPPPKPSQHRERLMWFLSPTPDVVDDFRIEQMAQMEEAWHKYNDRASRTLHDKMINLLLTKMLKPLAESIEEHEKMLALTGRNLANCPSSVSMLSMVLSANTGLAFNMPEIDSFINVGGSSQVEMRQYVINRIKELASNPRMAGYRYISQMKDMPTDADIIMHIFNQYLSLKEPYAIPPLVPVEGDLFKFLMIYVKITPELDHWRL